MGNPVQAANNRRARYNMLPSVENWTAAFKLTQEEARDIAVTYSLKNLLFFEKDVVWGKDGAPTYPKIGEKPKIKLANIGGVPWVPDNPHAKGWVTTGPLDLRTAVLAVRLAVYLTQESKWGVSTIYWGGMGVGRDQNDRHGKGLAIDFHGAMTRFGKIDVQADWGSQPVTLPDGKKVKEWPVHARPYFRLDVDTNAGGFFYAVYHFLAGESSDNGRDSESSIGDRSQILCPDTPDPNLRQYHQDHIHCEVGM
ncbi:MAG TPA: hypothetical protein VGI95_11620 [Caulobacteraceae bacterium]|jgi:hypothetical protein